ncbi:hypothetical protein AVEN_38013-1 [Araneus ventricosus]|uniref:Uncharacterized protein n=1 Tax=Araneus ventricosus TaxID=182803 RepID=A0A4Y2T169_ARAVE|nr:hypothetical protein AVEN_38013-1 [Araneus ventricosus]
MKSEGKRRMCLQSNVSSLMAEYFRSLPHQTTNITTCGKDFNYILFELNKWTLPGLQKQQTMAKCIASEAEHRALSEDKKETISHLP